MKKYSLSLAFLPLLLCAANAQAYFSATGTLEVKRPFTITRSLDRDQRRDVEKDQMDLTPGLKQFSVSESTYTDSGPCLMLVGCLGSRTEIQYLNFSLLENKAKKNQYRQSLAEVVIKEPSHPYKKGVSVSTPADTEQKFTVYKKSSQSQSNANHRTEERSCEEYATCGSPGAVEVGLFLFHNCARYGTQTVEVHDNTVTTHTQLKFLGERNEELATFTGSQDSTSEEIDSATECKF